MTDHDNVYDPEREPRDCEHGSLARACPLCEAAADLREALAEHDRLRDALDRIGSVAMNAVRGRHAPDCASLWFVVEPGGVLGPRRPCTCGAEPSHSGGAGEDASDWRRPSDRVLPEDDAIHAAHPCETGRRGLYAEAMRVVGARRSKGALVDLVNWLLARVEKAERERDAALRAGEAMADDWQRDRERLREAERERDEAKRELTDAYVSCPACSDAGGGDRSVYHLPPTCNDVAALRALRADLARANETTAALHRRLQRVESKYARRRDRRDLIATWRMYRDLLARERGRVARLHRIVWGVVHNAKPGAPGEPRRAAVKRATGLDSTSAEQLCVEYGADPRAALRETEEP